MEFTIHLHVPSTVEKTTVLFVDVSITISSYAPSAEAPTIVYCVPLISITVSFALYFATLITTVLTSSATVNVNVPVLLPVPSLIQELP